MVTSMGQSCARACDCARQKLGAQLLRVLLQYFTVQETAVRATLRSAVTGLTACISGGCERATTNENPERSVTHLRAK